MEILNEKVKLSLRELKQKTLLLKSISTDDNDKLNFAIKKLAKNIESVVRPLEIKYNDDLDDKRIAHASTYPETHPEIEKRGLLITKPDGNFVYTPENNKNFNKETALITKKHFEQIVEIEPYFAGVGKGWERVSTLDMFTVDELKGLLFKNVKDGVVLDDNDKN